MRLLLRDAEIEGAARADVRIAGDLVTEVAPTLIRAAGEEVLHCDGAALLPGLCDHHLHLLAMAAAERSVGCGPPQVRDRQQLARALANAPGDAHGWVRGVGYDESVAGDLDALALDGLHARRPVRLQHRSGALWMLNTLAMDRLRVPGAAHPGIERDRHGAPTGRVFRADEWLRARLPVPASADLGSVGARLARVGVTAVTDATPDLDARAVELITGAMHSGALPQRVQLLGTPDDVPVPSPARRGPAKIVLADSGLPALDALIDRIAAARAADRAVAVHCVTREALVLLSAALRSLGAREGDRVEHASVVPGELIDGLAALRLRVVTQPGFVAERGDEYRRRIPPDEHGDLYRCRSLMRAGVRIALSSDAPYAAADPWRVMRAAIERRTPQGHVLGPAERLDARSALDALLTPPDDPGGQPRRVRPGATADLVLLDRPLVQALSKPDADNVRQVFVAGRPLLS